MQVPTPSYCALRSNLINTNCESATKQCFRNLYWGSFDQKLLENIYFSSLLKIFFGLNAELSSVRISKFIGDYI